MRKKYNLEVAQERVVPVAPPTHPNTAPAIKSR